MNLSSIWTDPLKRRWLGWGTLTVAFLLVSFHRVSTAVIAEELMRAFDTTGAQLGLLHASFFYIYALLQLPSGVVVDRVGTRRVATVGVVVMSAGVIGFSVSNSYLVGFLTRTLIGLGGSVMYIATLRFCANWYRTNEFATMSGLTVAAAGAGGLFAATPLAFAVGMFGWRSSVFGVGLIGVGVALALYATVRRNPEKAGLRPIEGVISPPDVSVSDVLTNTKTVLKERETWLMGILLFFTLGANFTVLGLWGVPYIVDLYGVSVTQASTYVLLGNLGLVVGPPIIGWVSDRLGMRTELIVGASLIFTLAYGVIALTGVPPLFVVGVAFFVVMFLVGGFALTYTVVKELHPAEASGTATGTINSIGYFGAAILPAVMGAVLDVFWTGETVAGARVYSLLGYRVAFSIATACGVIALVCSVWLHFRTER